MNIYVCFRAPEYLGALYSFYANFSGNPEKAAEAIINIVESKTPLLRLLLEIMAYQVANHKYQNLLQNFEEAKETTLSADFE
ncbi:hypothetical protein [Bacillus sp. AFS017336]|uniref:hypothetical protein n=1 Tax=Bacillus sp. AFS017336 TaxID=2033489 RepID=UPI000BEF8DB2|nr:hypothetical protein [Bacillus sp. AFS017336]PEL13477.1 hypothetical protein CN601_04860 [Bacillus sp. AFS017336]